MYSRQDAPDVKFTSDPFVISVIDPCNPPDGYPKPTITATPQPAVTVYLTQVSTWDVVAFETDPEWCADEI